MNGRILRKHGFHGSVLDLDQSARNRIAHLGEKAQAILAVQDQNKWTAAAGPDFLLKVVAGAVVLKRIGLQTQEVIVIEDDGAHMAFMTCCVLALIAKSLDYETLKTLEHSLLLLAMCCPIEIRIPTLPPLTSLPANLQTHPEVQRQYANFRPASDDRHDIMLADALFLYRIFQQDDSQHFQMARTELKDATEGLRTAIRQLKDVSAK